MAQRPRFTIELTIRDNYGPDIYHRAIGCDEALRISTHAVDDLKTGAMAFSANPMAETVELLSTKELRRRILLETAERLAGQMADYMEDAEGWHDPERTGPARKTLGGTWR